MNNSINFFKKLFINLFLIFILISTIYGVNVNVTISESSTLTKLNVGGYSIVADGILKIHNPSQLSKIYEFNFPIHLDALLGINKVPLSSSSYVILVNNSGNMTNETITVPSGSEKFDFTYERIKGYMIEPNETISVGYHIYGLLDYNIYSKININNISVLEYYIEDFNFATNIILNLQKPEREGFIYNNDGPPQSLNSSPLISSNTTRLISAGIQNPTDFDFFIKNLKLFRTNTADPMYKEGDLIKTFYNLTLAPFKFKEVDFKDEKSSSNSVYWVSSDVIINKNIITSNHQNYIVEKSSNNNGGSSSSSGSSGGGFSGGGGGFFDNSDSNYNFSPLLLKKFTNITFIRHSEDFLVTLIVANIDGKNLTDLYLYDSIPDGYEIKSVSESVKIDGKNLKFKIKNISAYSKLEITYVLIDKMDKKGITFLKPAELNYLNNTIYSEGVLLINEILAEKKLFIQKEVNIIDENYSKIIIKVKNLGTISLKDLLIVDNIDDNAIIKDISKIFYEKGSWKIDELSAGEEWEVSYIVERIGNLDTLPNVYGVDKSAVFGTLISSEEVVTLFNEGHSIIEKVGLGFSVGLLVIYLLF